MDERLALLDLSIRKREQLELFYTLMGKCGDDLEKQYQSTLAYVQALTELRRCRELLAELDREAKVIPIGGPDGN